MKRSYRTYFLGSLLCAASAFSAEAATKHSKIYFESMPTNALVTVSTTVSSGEFSNLILGQCFTPCHLDLVRNGSNVDIRMKKSGYETKFERNYVIRKKSRSKKMLGKGDTVNWGLDRAVSAVLPKGRVVEPKPIFRFTPEAPKNLKEKQVCDVSFDIDTSGDVKNVKANCSKSSLEKLVIKTVEKWKYSPKLENDIAVVSSGHSVELRFSPSQ